MDYKSFTLGDWIGHISGVIEDERELDGNEMRDLVEFLTTLKQKSNVEESILSKVRNEIKKVEINGRIGYIRDARCFNAGLETALNIVDKYRMGGENKWLNIM